MTLSARARVALGVLSRLYPTYLKSGDFARDVSLLLEKRAANNTYCPAVFARAVGFLDYKRDEKGRPVSYSRLRAYPDLLAMSDKSAPLGFVTVADVRARRVAADRAAKRGGVK